MPKNEETREENKEVDEIKYTSSDEGEMSFRGNRDDETAIWSPKVVQLAKECQTDVICTLDFNS